MQIDNKTPFKAEALPFMGPDSKPILTVIIKGTFTFDKSGKVDIAEDQMPIAFGDEFFNEEEGGSVKFESDMVPFKPKADIVLIGSAHAPEGKLVQEIDVSLRVGELKKQLRVFGDRHWNVSSRLLSEYPSTPLPFSKMDIIYERAFGGIDRETGIYCPENLAGIGYYIKKTKKEVRKAPLPNIEDPGNLIKSRKSNPKPVGYGFYGKSWSPRITYLGTYDDTWRKERSPDPPEDFSFNFYNAAHPDLQVQDYIKSDESVELINLSPEGKVSFNLPGIQPTCIVSKHKAEQCEEADKQDIDYDSDAESLIAIHIDTLCLIPDERQFYIVWRGTCGIQDLAAKNIAGIEIKI